MLFDKSKIICRQTLDLIEHNPEIFEGLKKKEFRVIKSKGSVFLYIKKQYGRHHVHRRMLGSSTLSKVKVFETKEEVASYMNCWTL